ncbi:MAG TPA: flagellar protein FlaG [Clostridiales bacterium]|nr:flagellar protein FlaG [Clostridiales bacterium]
MALEAISNAIYHDVAKTAIRPKAEATIGQGADAATINIAEVPPTSTVAGTSGTDKEKGYGQNQGQGNAQAYDQQVKDAVSQVNSKLKMHRTRCEFSYHEETNRVSIKVFDKETNQVIREIPPEQSLEMVEKIWELAGFLVDEKR